MCIVKYNQFMHSFDHTGKNNTSPVLEMICGNIRRFGLDVLDYGIRMDFETGELFNFIRTEHSTVKMVANRYETAFTSMIDTSVVCENDHEFRSRVEEFIKVYLSVLFIHTVLTEQDIVAIKNGRPYCKNGIRSVLDRKENSLYITIFDENNRMTNNLLGEAS